MIGFRSLVRGVLPILFAPHVPRIGIFCLTHRCWPVLLPAVSIRSSSPSGWYENCFKPMALQVPGSPLRPYRSTSAFSGPCRCTCWGKTGRNCISQIHSWKLAYLLKAFAGATAQFWDGEVCCNNCLTALNTRSIIQDFTRSNDWDTLQQPQQMWQGLWLPQRLLIFN